MNLTEYDGYEGEVGEEAGQPQAAVEAAQHELHVGLQHAVALLAPGLQLAPAQVQLQHRPPHPSRGRHLRYQALLCCVVTYGCKMRIFFRHILSFI